MTNFGGITHVIRNPAVGDILQVENDEQRNKRLGRK